MSPFNEPPAEQDSGTGGSAREDDLPAQSSGWLRMFASLRVPSYRWLWIGIAASFTGLQMQLVARGWLVTEMTDSPLALGIVNGAFAVPLLAFSLFGGVIADRVRKKNLLLVAQAGLLATALIMSTLIQTDAIALWQLIAASFLIGTVFSFNMPTQLAIVPELVGEQSLMNAVALNSAMINLCRIAAPALAGFLLSTIGTAGVYWIISACYLLALASLSMMRVAAATSARPSAPIRKDLLAGLSYFRGNPTLVVLIVMAMVPSFFAMPYQMLMPVFARQVLGLEASGYGLLMSMTGVGALAGSLGIAAMGNFRHKGLLLLGSGMVFGASLVLFSLSRTFPLSLGILIVVGAGSAGNMALSNILLQLNTPHEMRGRVMSVYAMTMGLMPLGALPAGAIAEAVGIAPVVGVGGAVVLIVMVAMALTQARVRNLH